MVLTLVVCGDRKWTDYWAMRKKLSLWEKVHVFLIEGEAEGADKMARTIGEAFGWNVIPVHADWTKYGKSAGPIRNRQMLDLDPDLVLGFHKTIWTSKGTIDCLREAARRGIEVELIQ